MRGYSPGESSRPHTHTQSHTQNTLSVESPNVTVARGKFHHATDDPIRAIWDALANAGCQPHGELSAFRARCPGHQGSNLDGLSVTEASDRRVLLRCMADRCDWRTIVGALGLDGRALFPAGHKSGPTQRPARPVKPRPLSAGAAFLDTITQAGYPWRAILLLPECPYCGAEHCALRFADNPAGGDVGAWERFGVAVDCSSGCPAVNVRRAVETRAAIREKGLVL